MGRGAGAAPTPAATPAAATGRYVRIELAGNWLALAEVEVLSGGENVALNQPATMSTCPYGDAVAGAQKGVDGNQNPVWSYAAANSIFHTGNGGKEWWELDLGREYEIGRVTLFQADDCQDRLLGARIRVLDARRQPVHEWRIENIESVYELVPGAPAAESATASEGSPARTGTGWHDPERSAKVLALAPGSHLKNLSPETLFADWTKAQVERWQKQHPGETIEAACERAAAGAAAGLPSDREIADDFPVRISPYGRVRSGNPDPWTAERVLATGPPSGWAAYCPFCGSRTMGLSFDAANRLHATTTCCRKDLYGGNYPADYELKPTTTTGFPDLNGNVHQVPTTLYTDREGVGWELFIPTIFANKRWHDMAGLCAGYAKAFQHTADPAYAYKVALLLDKTADTYSGLSPAYINETCRGKDGQPLTRAEWEAVPRPGIFGPSTLGEWNRRSPMFNRGWVRQANDAVWAEPFARVRHHPAFQYYSRKVYGDPQALDRKVRQKLMREIALTWESLSCTGLLSDYQDAIYTNELLVAVLSERPSMLDFAAPSNELTLYNGYRQDGLCYEGAENYMAMPGGYYIPPLSDSRGTWQSLYPGFLKDHPFFGSAAAAWRQLRTVRGLPLEFGDQHIHALGNLLADAELVREREAAPSLNWPAYGLGLVRVGGAGRRMEVSLAYTRGALHTSSDRLGIACWVDGVPVMRPGGYGAAGYNRPLQFERPEIQGLQRMGYPREIVEAKSGDLAFGGWTHQPPAQNTISVNETFPSYGWQDNRGYGELIAFKGGEAAGDPGAGFQVLEARDRYSFERVGQPLDEFRRALLGVQGPDGRPYVVDIVTVRGGQRHALYNSAWAERGEAALPAVEAKAENLLRVLKPEKPDRNRDRILERIRNCEILETPAAPWGLTWQTDYAAYAPRDPQGKPLQRPLPDNVGRVCLRFFGLPLPGQETGLIHARGPWVAIINQPLSDGSTLNGNVGFLDANDLLIETHGTQNGETASRFVHVLEGYRNGEPSAIRSVRVVPLKTGATAGAIALEVARTDDTTDLILYQDAPRALELPDGLTTDARYALVRLGADGLATEAHLVEGTYLRGRGAELSGPARFTGVVTDLIGDLTGTRQESALILKPDAPWPAQLLTGCRQAVVEGPNALRAPFREGYAVDRLSPQADGTLRLDLAGTPPLAGGWHQVAELDPKRPDFFRTNRPMILGCHTPWYAGMDVWFPRLNKTFRFKTLTGGFHGSTEGELDTVNLAGDGVRPGDWFLVHVLKPGVRVTVANGMVWTRR
jgi:hypothetical protein